MVTVTLGALLSWLFAVIVMIVLIYCMWKAIQDGHARTSPGKAIGLLFIPVFNLYWLFQICWGFSRDYNRFVSRHSLPASKLPEGLFLASNITFVLFWFILIIAVLASNGWLGIVFAIAWLVNPILLCLAVARACDAVTLRS